jgi:hypothetical protein
MHTTSGFLEYLALKLKISSKNHTKQPKEAGGMKMKNVSEIVADHLRIIGADGLACDNCGCFLDNLFNCEEPLSCCPGVKHVVTKEDHEADKYRECEIGEAVCVPMGREKP